MKSPFFTVKTPFFPAPGGRLVASEPEKNHRRLGVTPGLHVAQGAQRGDGQLRRRFLMTDIEYMKLYETTMEYIEYGWNIIIEY